jgi:hypothetical protein
LSASAAQLLEDWPVCAWSSRALKFSAAHKFSNIGRSSLCVITYPSLRVLLLAYLKGELLIFGLPKVARRVGQVIPILL